VTTLLDNIMDKITQQGERQIPWTK